MVNQDILEKLRNSLLQGRSLHQAMMELFNAGHPKEEIEEAARVLYYQQYPSQSQKKVPMQAQKPEQEKPSSSQGQVQTKQPQMEANAPKKVEKKYIPQRVSSYGEKQKKSKKVWTILLIILLFILLSSLAVLLIFREQISNLLGFS